MKEEQMDFPTISIVMIAYNVEKYIGEAIESVLAQKTSYSYELVIGEDCSTDDTRQIALAYESKYPDKIRVIQNKSNLGLTPNCVETHNHCRGKYIALLDSDDYWTDENKLQKQVDFLENNLDFAGSGHQSIKIYENNLTKRVLFGEQQNRVYTLMDMLTHRKFHTSSFVYRKEIWDKTGGIPKNISSNERAIYPMVAIFGKIKYFKDEMCVYRFSGEGLSSRIDYRELETDFNMFSWLKEIDKNFPIYRFKSFIHLCVYTYGTTKIPFRKLAYHYLSFSILSLSYFPKNLGDLKWGTIFFFQKFLKIK
ncbi:MAG: glycosyltransferase family 2 protein [Brumimicrobium sp.]|nr:glycosyltransferase family 2 protein [Brumimicrobium sp.]MCO5269630.1 glycosyltransferase [Brumimicrobium sp.]